MKTRVRLLAIFSTLCSHSTCPQGSSSGGLSGMLCSLCSAGEEQEEEEEEAEGIQQRTRAKRMRRGKGCQGGQGSEAAAAVQPNTFNHTAPDNNKPHFRCGVSCEEEEAVATSGQVGPLLAILIVFLILC